MHTVQEDLAERGMIPRQATTHEFAIFDEGLVHRDGMGNEPIGRLNTNLSGVGPRHSSTFAGKFARRVGRLSIASGRRCIIAACVSLLHRALDAIYGDNEVGIDADGADGISDSDMTTMPRMMM
jgi:hypothetical protein